MRWLGILGFCLFVTLVGWFWPKRGDSLEPMPSPS